MAHYLVTGGAGFIGSHLTDRLLAGGHRVTVLDDFSTGRRSNLAEATRKGGEKLRVVEGDLRSDADLANAVRGVDGVFHEAALGSVPRSVADPLTTHEVNGTGTLKLLLAMRESGVRRIVFAGSSSVYGSLEKLPKSEDDPTAPISPYGLSKLLGEEYLRLFRELYGMETVTLRYYNVFGPRQDPRGQYAAVIPIFVSKLLRGEAPVIDGDGSQSRDFTYVGNVVDANLLAMEAPAERIAPGLFNVAVGGRHSIKELYEKLSAILGVRVKPVHGPARAGDVPHSQADVTLAREHLGFKPTMSFQEGLERTVAYFREHPEGQ